MLDAFAGCARSDVELSVWSASGPATSSPTIPGSVADRYEMVDRSVYDGRLRSLDVLVLPFAEADMITTGTVGRRDRGGRPGAGVGLGVPARRRLGDAGIPYGDDLTGAIDAAGSGGARPGGRGGRSGCGRRARRTAVADSHLDLLEAVGTSRL